MKNRRVRWVLVILVVLVVGLLLLRTVVVPRTRMVVSRQERFSAMADALVAIENYRGYFRAYPSAVHRDELGRPTCSWRLAVRRFFEQVSRPIEQLDRRWYSPVNLAWVPDPYGQRFSLTRDASCASSLVARIVVITGPGTVFSVREGHAGTIPDDVILLIEMADSGVVWSEPGDLDVRSVPPSITHGLDGAGVCIAFADGRIWYLDRSVPLERLKHFFTIEGAERHDCEEELLPYRREAFSWKDR